MKVFSLISTLMVGLLLIPACIHTQPQNEKPFGPQTLTVTEGYRGHSFAITEGVVKINFPETGGLDYKLDAEISIGGLQRYQASFEDHLTVPAAMLQFDSYRTDKTQYLMRANQRIVSVKKARMDGAKLWLNITHLDSGISALVEVTKRADGKLRVHSAEVQGQSDLAIDDPEGATETKLVADNAGWEEFRESVKVHKGRFMGAVVLK
ncbi:MAG: hypothetical protein HRU19_28580 [Pseudobacteriovorax sp.]|nr:hypothetical protein [Pseudobacteriovorax sp.]